MSGQQPPSVRTGNPVVGGEGLSTGTALLLQPSGHKFATSAPCSDSLQFMWTVTQLMGTKEYRDVTQMKHTLFQSYGEFSELASDIRLLQRSLLKGKACTGAEVT